MTIERPMFPPVDPTRRRLLTIAAAGATALTVAPARAAPAADPIYAAIQRHKAACVPRDAAIDVRAEFPESADPMTDEQWEQRDAIDDAVDEARVILEQAGLDLINTAPTTLAGIVTAIEYMRRQMRNDGTYMPYGIEFQFDDLYAGDGGIVLGWIDARLDTITAVVAALDRQGGAA
jgi:alkanesulfonate monooxygenase SsuD/methylene tetrahydromethanopterin reductase-like flavin-dependent oxidoreductase (luciferase family)